MAGAASDPAGIPSGSRISVRVHGIVSFWISGKAPVFARAACSRLAIRDVANRPSVRTAHIFRNQKETSYRERFAANKLAKPPLGSVICLVSQVTPITARPLVV